MSLQNTERLTIRERLHQDNLFVELPDALIGQEALVTFLEGLPKKFINVNSVNSVLTQVVLEDRDGWEPINPNMELLADGDSSELTRVSIGISKRKQLMQMALRDDVHFVQQGETYEMRFRGEPIGEASPNVFTSILAKSKTAQDAIITWTNWLAETEGSVLAVGPSAERINTKALEIIRPSIDSQDLSEATLAYQSRSVLRRLAREANHMSRLEEEQASLEVPRDQFIWASNPLIAEFRSAARTLVTENVSRVQAQGVTEFDLVTQVMMHLAIYEPHEVWRGNDELVEEVRQLLLQEKGDEALTKFRAGLESGTIQLNEDLARYECERQTQKLADHYQSLSVTMDGREIKLPAPYMGDPALNPFKGVEKTEINAKDRQYEIDPVTGEKVMIVVERKTGKRIQFKSVRPEISYLYSVGFSNLHYPREGETAIFGAYLEGDELPFAYSSYTPVVRGYSRDMLTYLGANPDNVMESARAWNSAWSPENTMSVLFAFAHDTMREKRDAEIKAGAATEPLEGVFTSINPNLGFKAVSFRGVRFNVAGMKPTSFSYLRNGDGSADFMPKGEIKKKLGIWSDIDLAQSPAYTSNVTPFLPTLEMLTLFDMESERALLNKPIYRVSEEAFQRN